MLDRTNYNDKERRYINALSPTEEERKRAETLYAKYKIKWAGYDQRTRLKWLKQMASTAPAWTTIFKLVWFLFYTDGALQEAQRVEERIEVEAREQKAKAEAEAEAFTRQQWEKDVALVRKVNVESQRRKYQSDMASRVFGISLIIGYLLAGVIWGWNGIGVLIGLRIGGVPIVQLLHYAASFLLGKLISHWFFRPVELGAAEIEQKVKKLREEREKRSQRTGRPFTSGI